jgi:hypothetical protein
VEESLLLSDSDVDVDVDAAAVSAFRFKFESIALKSILVFNICVCVCCNVVGGLFLKLAVALFSKLPFSKTSFFQNFLLFPPFDRSVNM